MRVGRRRGGRKEEVQTVRLADSQADKVGCMTGWTEAEEWHRDTERGGGWLVQGGRLERDPALIGNRIFCPFE